MMRWAVILGGVCIAKIVWDGAGSYTYPHPHDELIHDPDNTIAVAVTDPEHQPAHDEIVNEPTLAIAVEAAGGDGGLNG